MRHLTAAEPPPEGPIVRWTWIAAPHPNCYVGTWGDAPDACICLLNYAARLLQKSVYEDETPDCDEVGGLVALALGPGRPARIEVRCRTRPPWVPVLH
jgi:hypothetical protein